MNIVPLNQNKLLGFKNEFKEFINMHKKNILPNKILLSGKKGIGKSTFAYHFINYIYSIDEEYSYDLNENIINFLNRSFKLINNGSHPNFFKISLNSEKKFIEINQVREMIPFLNKSSFNNNIKIVLIDDVEFLSINAANSLLKNLEEPSENTYFILIHNNSKKIIQTIKSRCIEFKLTNTPDNIRHVVNNYFNENLYDQLSNDFKLNLTSASDFINLINIINKNKLNITSTTVEDFINFFISNYLFKKDDFLKNNFKIFLEIYFKKKILNFNSIELHKMYSYFNKKYYHLTKFNLDVESYLIEFNAKVLDE